MKLIDISWPVSETTTEYKNNDTILFEPIKTFEHDAVRNTRIALGAHVGTHVDAPSHFLAEGKHIDQVPLSTLIGKAKVLDCTDVADAITSGDLERHDIAPGDIILLRTRNSLCGITDPFNPEFIFLDESGARYLAHKKAKAVGIDYLGIERGHADHPTHTVLMNADITIIEGLRLAHAKPGPYFCICLPLALVGIEAAPARAILLEI